MQLSPSISPVWATLLVMVSSTSAAAVAIEKRTNYWVDSQSGDVATFGCDTTYSNIWGLCDQNGCNGEWEQLSQVNLPCIPVGGEDPSCAELEPEFFCRRVSGGYNGGWADRNGLLTAYFRTNYCYTDGNFFFVGDQGTPEWSAMRGDNGAWINIEFKIGIDNC
jgi:hypothetical protein